MPKRKNVPVLKDLCIGNVARNILMHAERFKECGQDERIYAYYKTFQFLFSDDLLRMLYAMYKNQDHEDQEFAAFLKFLFRLKKSNNLDYWPAIEFLYNSHTTSAFQDKDTDLKYGVENEVLRYIISKCKNLKYMNMDFRNVKEDAFRRMIPTFHNLVDVNLQLFNDGQILPTIIRMCPLVRKIEATAIRFTRDPDLFMLCRYNSRKNQYVFCRQNGACFSGGRHLQILNVQTCISEYGIACALQHLPRLKEFLRLPSVLVSGLSDYHIPDVLRGIVILQEAAAAKGEPPVTLQLSDIFFNESASVDELRTVISCCPKLETVEFNLFSFKPQDFSTCFFPALKRLFLNNSTDSVLNSAEFRQFVLKHCKRIKSLHFGSCYAGILCVNSILEMCCNVTDLLLWKRDPSKETHHIPCLPPSIANLEKINLSRVSLHTRNTPAVWQSDCRYFLELLGGAKNVKYLTVDSYLAEDEFVRSMEINEFTFLEELCIQHYANISKIPLGKLVNADNNLRKLKFYYCDEDDFNFHLYKKIARENNYKLEIEIEPME